MGNGASQRQQNFLQQSATDAQNRQTDAFLKAQQKSPIEQAREKETTDWFDFKSGKNGAVDYAKAPGLVHAGMFETADANAQDERTGVGSARLGAAYANPNFQSAQLQSESAHRAQRNAESETAAVVGRDAQMEGQGSQLDAMNQQRLLSILGSASGAASSSLGAYAQFRPQASPWFGVASAGLGGLSSIFSGGFGGGSKSWGFNGGSLASKNIFG